MEKNTNATPKPIDHAYAQQAIQSFLKRYEQFIEEKKFGNNEVELFPV